MPVVCRMSPMQSTPRQGQRCGLLDAGSVSFVSLVGKQSSDEPLVHVLSVSAADAQLVSCLDEGQKGKTRR